MSSTGTRSSCRYSGANSVDISIENDSLSANMQWRLCRVNVTWSRHWVPNTEVKYSKLDICIALWLTAEHSGMARVNKGSHSFTCHPHVHPQMKWAILPLLPSLIASLHIGWYSFSVPLRVGGRVGLGVWLHTEVVCPSKDGNPSQY